MADVLEKLREAYAEWDASKASRKDKLLGLLADDFVMRSVAPRPEGLAAFGEQRGPAMAAAFLQAVHDTWVMDYYRVDSLLGDDSEVVMFGECRFVSRATGAGVTTPIANRWRFRDGKAIELIEVFDSAAAATAATPRGPGPA